MQPRDQTVNYWIQGTTVQDRLALVCGNLDRDDGFETGFGLFVVLEDVGRG